MTDILLFIIFLIFIMVQTYMNLWEIKKIDEICNGTKKEKREMRCR